MADVGALAGVTARTVSNVLSNSTAVRPETRERVLRAVDELGYQGASAHLFVACALVRTGPLLVVTATGREVRALLDSGAAATVLSRPAAERIGIDLSAPDVKASGTSYGIGAHQVKTWTVRIDKFSVGTETIQHSQMQVIDGRLGDGTDMLLGVDFILAHHMFIANSQAKAYFTYNGGRVFSFADAPSDGEKAATVAELPW